MVIKLKLKDAIVLDGMRITFDRINDAFMNGQLREAEMARLFKKFPEFHKWFLVKHRQVFI